MFAVPNVLAVANIASHLWKRREYSIPTQSSAGFTTRPLHAAIAMFRPSCKVSHTKVLPTETNKNLRNKWVESKFCGNMAIPCKDTSPRSMYIWLDSSSADHLMLNCRNCPAQLTSPCSLARRALARVACRNLWQAELFGCTLACTIIRHDCMIYTNYTQGCVSFFAKEARTPQ